MQTTINRSVSTQSLNPNVHVGQYSSIGTIANKSSIPKISEELNTFRQCDESAYLANFKLLLKCLRRWKRFVNEQLQQRRFESDKLVEDLAVSIHFHE